VEVSPVDYGVAASEEDLEQILALQRRNLEPSLGPEAVARDGFVTVRHDLELLRDMNRAAPHVVARSAGRVVGYALVMLRAFEARIPILAPMYDRLSALLYTGRAVADSRYFIMGQVCVGEPFRGTGVFAGLYAELRVRYARDFEMVITEVARRNGRSIRAHAKVGFELLHRYRDPAGEEWDVIVWDWSSRIETPGPEKGAGDGRL
jgi:L-amino acid N-acyltransferase YncA